MNKSRIKLLIESLKNPDNGVETMYATKRGTLVMSAKSVINSKKFKDLISLKDRIIIK